MGFKKIAIVGLLSLGCFVSAGASAFGLEVDYKVNAGDTFYTIGKKFNVSMTEIMKHNNADWGTTLSIGQNLTIPLGEQVYVHVVTSGDTYWKISQKYQVALSKIMTANDANSNSGLWVGQKVLVPLESHFVYHVQAGDTFYLIAKKYGISLDSLISANNFIDPTNLYYNQQLLIPIVKYSSPQTKEVPTETTDPSITYETYYVQSGDTIWGISIKAGVPVTEILSTNNLSDSTVLYIGMKLKIPVHHIPIKNTPGPQYGELLDWWTEAQYVVPIGSKFEVIDFYTGNTFWAKRTTGSYHADVENLSTEDAEKMKEIWGGDFSWARRPIIVNISGRKIAASASGMPHAGNDSAPGGVWTSWRSDDYGAGTNFDYIKNNGTDGHFDIHFINSKRHKDGEIDNTHQENIKIAGGL